MKGGRTHKEPNSSQTPVPAPCEPPCPHLPNETKGDASRLGLGPRCNSTRAKGVPRVWHAARAH